MPMPSFPYMLLLPGIFFCVSGYTLSKRVGENAKDTRIQAWIALGMGVFLLVFGAVLGVVILRSG
jgi:tellurite resistance protein TehA-like permease